MISVPQGIFAQIVVESSIDWSTGRFELMASEPLGSGMSPSDHPQALTALERNLPPYVIKELGRLAWNRRGTLEEQMEKNPSLRTTIENLARSLNREWSRLSENRKSVEASYSIELAEVLPRIIPAAGFETLSGKPIGWVAVPDDGWTGILIYVPKSLPVRGTSLFSDVRPALYARVLSENLEVLADPALENGKLLSYRSLESREKAESLIGRRPYKVMARELYGEYPCDIILSEEDTRRILAADSGRQALSDGKIVILLDSGAD